MFDFEWINANYYAGSFVRTTSFFEGTEFSCVGVAASAAERAILDRFRARCGRRRWTEFCARRRMTEAGEIATSLSVRCVCSVKRGTVRPRRARQGRRAAAFRNHDARSRRRRVSRCIFPPRSRKSGSKQEWRCWRRPHTTTGGRNSNSTCSSSAGRSRRSGTRAAVALVERIEQCACHRECAGGGVAGRRCGAGGAARRPKPCRSGHGDACARPSAAVGLLCDAALFMRRANGSRTRRVSRIRTGSPPGQCCNMALRSKAGGARTASNDLNDARVFLRPSLRRTRATGAAAASGGGSPSSATIAPVWRSTASTTIERRDFSKIHALARRRVRELSMCNSRRLPRTAFRITLDRLR